MWDKFDATSHAADFLAWGRRIAYHKVLDFYKKSQRAQARLSRVFLERLAATAADEAEVLRLDERRDALAACIEKLAPRDRDLLTRRFADGATTQSTSQQLGRSVDAVYKALAKLRRVPLRLRSEEHSPGRADHDTRIPDHRRTPAAPRCAVRGVDHRRNRLARLEELVLDHPEAEAHYIQFMSFYADLIGHVAGLPERPCWHPRRSRIRSPNRLRSNPLHRPGPAPKRRRSR